MKIYHNGKLELFISVFDKHTGRGELAQGRQLTIKDYLKGICDHSSRKQFLKFHVDFMEAREYAENYAAQQKFTQRQERKKFRDRHFRALDLVCAFIKQSAYREDEAKNMIGREIGRRLKAGELSYEML